MVNYLRKKFIKNYDDITNENVRSEHGKLAAIFGIISNMFLFCIKLIIGIVTFNISIVSDSVNNLSDMSSSIVVLIGFHVAKAPADKEHPFGHERAEYIAGLIVANLIIVSGVIMGYTSINAIIDYEYKPISLTLSLITAGILLLSIIVKIYQALFNYKLGRIIKSDALKATATDSRNDVLSTTLALLGVLLVMTFELNNDPLSFSIDGILGALISLYIIYSGIMMFKSTMNPLLGTNEKPSNEKEILADIISNPIIIDIHDVMYHHYGPTKIYMTAHAEVDSRMTLNESHDAIDNTEMQIKEKYGINLTIHIDPVDLESDDLLALKEVLSRVMDSYDSELKIHDLRILKGYIEPTMEFDIIIPYGYSKDDDLIIHEIKSRILEENDKYKIIINIDHE
ncbi:MAG: cation diffusion facilitator family transporter [Acholeplasmatales bacterium]|nr:cation diffusion facilitator family transporter [Acholeplasmatales bacterium]